ncbi:MAG: polysulfide reductase NrfD [Bacteroidales bacterium]|nr:polysulfide reductase NrfD [Bacteroidales bacterium]
MIEEINVSGRNIPHVYPHLELWHWPIPVYLFLGGLAAGILFFAAINFLTGKAEQREVTTKWTPFVVPVLLMVGLAALFYDLSNKLFFWQLYTTIRLDSPMSWGAWVLLLITPLSILWCMTYLKEGLALLEKKSGYDSIVRLGNTLLDIKLIKSIVDLATQYRAAMAWGLLLLSLILGIYTGILLSAFNARPLWNTSILGPLFLLSGLSAAAGLNMWMTNNYNERKLFGQIDLVLIAMELVLIIHMFMGFRAGSEVSIQTADLFLGGEFTFAFWGLVVGLGLVFPAILEVLKLRGKKIHIAIPASLILLGGIIFRFIMVEAGQVSAYL